jgi:hypothetical protein
MLHDFEEILLVGAWKQRYAPQLAQLKKNLPFGDFISTDSFSCAVAEEFVIFSAVTWISCLLNNYVIWFGLFFAVVFHFLIHAGMSLRFGHYVPGVLTSLLFLPPGIWLIYQSVVLTGYDSATLILAAGLGTLFGLGNVVFLHRAMATFSRWLERYARPL